MYIYTTDAYSYTDTHICDNIMQFLYPYIHVYVSGYNLHTDYTPPNPYLISPSAAYMRQWTGSSLVQLMACRLIGAKPLPEPVLAYCHLDSWKHISVKFESEVYHFHSRKHNWKCRLPKWLVQIICKSPHASESNLEDMGKYIMRIQQILSYNDKNNVSSPIDI